MNYISEKPVKDSNGRVVKAVAKYKDVTITFIRQGDTFKELKSIRLWIPDDVNKAIIKQARGIFKIPFAQSSTRKFQLPTREKIHADALKLNDQTFDLYFSIKYLQGEKSWTECNFLAHKNQRQPELATRYYGQEKYWLRDLRSAGVKILTDGWLEISRWENGNIIWQKAPDIDTALRMQEHILDGYLQNGQADPSLMLKDNSIGEIASLNSIEEVVALANNTLANWQAAAADKEFLTNKLTWAALQLIRCRNEFKITARRQIYKSSGLKDESDRLNPAAMAARTVAALRQLNYRLAELGILVPYIAMRHSTLLLEKRRIEKNLKRAAGVALLLARSWSKVSTTDRANPSKSILGSIDWTRSYLSSVWLSPYFERARQAEYYIIMAQEQIMKKNFAQAQSFFIDVYKILTDKPRRSDEVNKPN